MARAHESLVFRAMTIESTATIVMESVRVKSAFVPLLVGQSSKKIQDYYNSLMADLRSAQALLNYDWPGYQQLSKQAKTGYAETTQSAADFAALADFIMADNEIMAKARAVAEEVRMDLDQ